MGNTAAITTKLKRRKNDAYFTPEKAVNVLLDNHKKISGNVLEPCCGEGSIVNQLIENGLRCVGTDIAINPERDATKEEYWKLFNGFDWVITNPPFNCAHEIIPLAYENCKVGIAFLLRLSYLEPCQNRASWLVEHPPTKIIVMPRISFTNNGKTDSMTTAWIIWEKTKVSQEIIIVSSF